MKAKNIIQQRKQYKVHKVEFFHNIVDAKICVPDKKEKYSYKEFKSYFSK